MPTNKDFKRLIRARMEKTGEAYTSARANLLRVAPVPPKIDYAALAGMSDAALKKQTGCNWEKWVWALDKAGAESWSHRAIAEYVHDVYKVKDWWTQTVTVGYERIKGLRAIGQRRDGAYEATKSKTFAAPAADVFRAFNDARVRRRWLPGIKVVVRRAKPNQSVRMTWPDDTSVEVWLVAKGAKKTGAQVQHRKLASREDADQRRAFWEDRLAVLGQTIEAHTVGRPFRAGAGSIASARTARVRASKS